MVTIQVKNIEGKTVLPIAGSELAAGYDIVAIDDPVIVGESITKEGDFFPLYHHIDYIEYHTALYISPLDASPEFTHHNRETYHTLLHPRSSIRKYNLVLANSIGLIDNDYRGELILCFKYIWQPEDFVMESGSFLGKINREKIYKKGDKIGQLVAEKTNPTEFVLVNELDATARGRGGFGSSDNKEEPSNPSIIKIQGKLQQANPKDIKAEKAQDEESNLVTGHIIDKYQKAGGIPVRKKYSDEVKEREQL